MMSLPFAERADSGSRVKWVEEKRSDYTKRGLGEALSATLR